MTTLYVTPENLKAFNFLVGRVSICNAKAVKHIILRHAADGECYSTLRLTTLYVAQDNFCL